VIFNNRDLSYEFLPANTFQWNKETGFVKNKLEDNLLLPGCVKARLLLMVNPRTSTVSARR